MKPIILYGAGGHSFAATALIESLGEYAPSIVYDDAPKLTSVLNVAVEKYNDADLTNVPLCITIGTNSIRKKLAEKLNGEYPSFIHKSAAVFPSVSIGCGTLVHPNAVLDADVCIGNHCIINNNATVSHNVKIGDYVHIAIQAAVAGGVTIGEGTLVGAGSVILPEVKVGKWVTIGAGAVVTKDIPDYAVVYGNPAKKIRDNSKNE
ncbi:acetyltransferase [Constantimarinum furrinae]|uniref:Acetyltransferase EpsM n=1 Tax=Constantimarinum furrinae TaxID=2562285 RepID=A0A7G8PX75_9FLAO|nr:acetyltransferase [Constantimarinum furrinae]QNJ98941.1 acetyltransferase EpsM [Constantimarinum furrinae]